MGILRRYAPWILVCSALVGGVARGISDHQTKKYTAAASLVFHNDQLGRGIAGPRPAGGTNQQAQPPAIVKLVKLRDVAAKTARHLGRRVTEGEIRAALRVSAHGGSNIVNVSATATSPVLAAAIANTYAGLVVARQQSRVHASYAAPLRRVEKKLAVLSQKERGGPQGSALLSRRRSLQLFDRLHRGNAVVTHTAAVPRSPSSPKVTKNTALGSALGALLGLVIALLLDHRGRRIRAPEYLSAIYQLPMLGAVPRSSALARASGQLHPGTPEPLPSRVEEAMQLIRTRLRYFNIDRERRTLAVVSAAPADGRTTIARHLASTAARAGSAVLLLEADLRRPVLARQLDLQPGPGLSDVLTGSVSLSGATQPVALEQSADSADHPLELDVLVAGALLPPNPAELLQSRAMAAVLERTKETYEVVVIDTSPLSVFHDAFALLGRVDGVMIAGRVGSDQRRAAKQLHEALARLRVPLLGVVANCADEMGPGAHRYAPHLYQHPAASAERQSFPHERDYLAPNGSPRASRRNGASRSSTRFKRGAPRMQQRSEDDSHTTAGT